MDRWRPLTERSSTLSAGAEESASQPRCPQPPTSTSGDQTQMPLKFLLVHSLPPCTPGICSWPTPPGIEKLSEARWLSYSLGSPSLRGSQGPLPPRTSRLVLPLGVGDSWFGAHSSWPYPGADPALGQGFLGQYLVKPSSMDCRPWSFLGQALSEHLPFKKTT